MKRVSVPHSRAGVSAIIGRWTVYSEDLSFVSHWPPRRFRQNMVGSPATKELGAL
jgi:hypothetical protein